MIEDLPLEPDSLAAKSFAQTLWPALVLMALVVAFLVLGAVTHAGSMMGALGCGW